jgi:TonB-linked SusC/RagA family outer membrane protein
MKKSLTFVLLLFLGYAISFAQGIQVSGTVTDAEGNGLPGVNVVIKGTTTGAVTNLDGYYSITAPGSDAVLVYSYVGYLTQEIAVGNQTSINVTLEEDVLGLEEVVVIGYGTQRKIDVTGSVATMNSDDIAPIPTPNFEEGMQGKVPGMEMKKTSAEPGGGISVKIRGTNSLLGNNEPLYVIDGFPIVNDNRSRAGGWEGQQSLNTLSNLNPADIESIQVLKDASATAIYGSRAANGVIIITTKKGRSGNAMVDFEYSHTWSTAKAPYELCGVEDYARIENESIINTGGTDFRYTADNNYGLQNATPEELGARFGHGTDWLDEVLQTGHVNNYNFSVQGGNERTTYLISANYYDEKGVVIASDFKRGTIRANVNSQVSKRLTAGINISGSRYDAERFRQTGRLTGGGPDRLGTIVEAFRANPMTQLDTPHTEPNDLLQHEPGQGNVTNFIYHPVKQALNTDNNDRMNFIIASMNVDYSIIDGLDLVFRGGANFQNQERINFQPFNVPVGKWYSGIGNHWFYDSRQYLFENYLSFNKTFGGNHSIDATLGYSLEYIRAQTKSQGGSGFNFDIQRIYGWAQLAVPSPMGISESQRTLASVYGRLFYNFKDRYLVTFTARQDGSSVFAKNNKFAFFPSVAVGWVLSEEGFMSGADWLSNLKLRGSYGLTGNQAIGPYQSLARVGSASYVIANAKVSGLTPISPANPDLIWETTKQTNIGLDASFLANRIQFSADFYKKNTVDLLQSKPVLSTTGYETFTTNFGEVSNTGVELLLGGAILTGTLKWNSTLTWSVNRGKVEDLGLAADGTPLEIALPPSNQIAHQDLITMFVVGQPIGTFWGYEWLGLLSQADVDAGVPVAGGLNEPGDMKFLDYNGDDQITADDGHPIGNPEPDFIFGFDNTFTYKNLSLNFFFNGVIGSKMLNLIKQYTHLGMIRNAGGHHSQEYVDDYWTPDRTDAKYPRPGGGSGAISTFFLEDASFVRLQTVSLNYRIPTDQFGWNWIRNATVYVRGSNVFVITNYTGFDPEGQFQGQTDYNQNIDLGNYPRPRSFELGVRLGF